MGGGKGKGKGKGGGAAANAGINRDAEVREHMSWVQGPQEMGGTSGSPVTQVVQYDAASTRCTGLGCAPEGCAPEGCAPE